MSLFVGSLISIVFLIVCEEKIGKRKMILVTFFAACLGGLLLFLSKSIVMIGVSLFMIGLGIFAPIRYGIAIISDVT